VECDVAAAIAFEEFDAAVFQEFRGGYHVCGFRIPAKRDYWPMFEQEEDVAYLFFFAERD
jgi:hypothetical protein